MDNEILHFLSSARIELVFARTLTLFSARMKIVSGRPLFIFTLTSFLAFLVAASHARAWGHLKEFNTEWAPVYLVFAAAERAKIQYCISVSPQFRAEFPEESVNVQVEAALQAWLNPAQEKGWVGAVAITKVDCDSKDLNLKISIDRDLEHPRLGAYQAEVKEGGRLYSFIKINTDFRSRNSVGITDFKNLLKIETQMELVQTLDHFSLVQGYSVQDLSGESGIGFVPLFWSTYRILLHEIGHSFGLCDTASKMSKTTCDPRYLTPVYSDTVMSDSSFFSLTEDDEMGLTQLFERFSSRNKSSFNRHQR